MKVIGLTGGIACGKSSVSAILSRMGIMVVSSDELAHQALEPGNRGFAEVISEFGEEYIGQDGRIDRQKLGALVFANEILRRRLESIIHPIVIAEIQNIIGQQTKQGLALLVVEVPLLFEAGLTDMFDEIWVVSTTEKEQIKRLRERDHLPIESANLRLKSQLPLKDKESRADHIIYNNRGLVELEEEVKALLQRGVNLKS